MYRVLCMIVGVSVSSVSLANAPWTYHYCDQACETYREAWDREFLREMKERGTIIHMKYEAETRAVFERETGRSSAGFKYDSSGYLISKKVVCEIRIEPEAMNCTKR